MSFATAIRNRNSDRLIALVTAIGVVMSLMVIFAPAAQAHHTTITSGIACDEQTGEKVVTWSVTNSESTKTFDFTAVTYPDGETSELPFTDVGTSPKIELGETVPASGVAKGEVRYAGNATGVKVLKVSAQWNTGQTQNNNTGSQDLSEIDCEPPEKEIVQTNGIVGECQVGEGGAFASVQVTVDPSGGATVNIYDDAAKGAADLVATFTQNGNVDLPPGTYYWEVIVSPGYVHEGEGEGPLEGDFTIEDCTPTDTTRPTTPPVDTTPPTTQPIPPDILPTSIVATTIPQVTPTVVETLPFTGAESGSSASLALVLLAAGALALVGARAFRADADE